MKKFNKWINEQTQQLQQTKSVKEKLFKTDSGKKYNIDDLLNMIAYSIESISSDKQIQSNKIELGHYYLYTNKEGATYPIRVLSFDHTMKTVNGEVFTPGENENDETISKGNITVQYTDIKNGVQGKIEGKKSNAIAVLISKLKPIPDNYKWNDINLKELLKQYTSEESEKTKKMLAIYVKNHLIQEDFDTLVKYQKNAAFSDFVDFIAEILKKKTDKSQIKETKPEQKKITPKQEPVQKQSIQKQPVQKQSGQQTQTEQTQNSVQTQSTQNTE